MSGNTSATGGYLQPISPLPADDVALDTIIHDFVVGLTGLAPTLVFPRWQPQPPTLPAFNVNWGAVGITNFSPVGPWPDQIQETDYLTQVQQQKMEVLASFYGPQSSSFASLFFDGMTIRQNLDTLGVTGIKLLSVGHIVHVPELINTQFVGRSDVSFTLIREIDRNYAVETILSSSGTITTASADVVTVDLFAVTNS